MTLTHSDIKNNSFGASLLRLALMVVMLMGVGNVWGQTYTTTTTAYDFEDGKALFTADSRITATVEDNTDLSSKVVAFTCASNAQNGYSFAHYDISSLVKNASIVTFNFDYYNTDGGRAILTIGDATIRGTTGASEKVTYNDTGAIFALGSDKDNALINGTNQTKTAYTDKWLNVNVKVNIETKKVTYTIKERNGNTLASGEDVAFYSSNASSCSQIDLFGYINNSKCAMLDNLSITVSVDASKVFADYTITYVAEGIASLKDSRTANAQAGTTCSITDDDKKAIDYDSKHYIYVSDDASTKTVNADGSTVVTVTFRKAASYGYTVTSSYGGHTLPFSTSGTTWEDAPSVTIPYPRYQQDGTILVGRAPVNNNLQTNITVDHDGATADLAYTATDIIDLYRLSEAEDLSTGLETNATNFTSRVSNQQIIYGASGTLMNLPAGKYKFTLGVIGGDTGSHPVNYIVNAGETQIIQGTCTGAFLTELTSDWFTLTEATAITFTCSDPASNRGIDLVYVRSAVWYPDASGTINMMAGETKKKPSIYNAEGATYTSSDESVATVASDGTITAVSGGTAVITASLNGNTSTYTVTVQQLKFANASDIAYIEDLTYTLPGSNTLTNTTGEEVTFSATGNAYGAVSGTTVNLIKTTGSTATGEPTENEAGYITVTATANVGGTDYSATYKLYIKSRKSVTLAATYVMTTGEDAGLLQSPTVDFSDGTKLTIGAADESQVVTKVGEDFVLTGIGSDGSLTPTLNASGIPTNGTFYKVVMGSNQRLMVNALNLSSDTKVVDASGAAIPYTISGNSLITDALTAGTTVYIYNASSALQLSQLAVANFEYGTADAVAYVEDIEYTNNTLTNTTGMTPTYSTSGYNGVEENGLGAVPYKYRHYNGIIYPAGTTGDDPTDLNEGDPITVTATAGAITANYTLRLKTRHLYDPQEWASNDTWAVPNSETLGMLTSNTVSMEHVTMTIGNAAETQVVRQIGSDYALTGIDFQGFTFKYLEGGKPTLGTYYTFVATSSGQLTVTGYFVGEDAAILYDALHKKEVGRIVSTSELATGTFDVTAGFTYYLYADDHSTFALKSVSFVRKTSGTVTIDFTSKGTTNDLLHYGGENDADGKLDRSIPGFDITFGGTGQATYKNIDNGIKLTMSTWTSTVDNDGGRFTISPRVRAGGNANKVELTAVKLYMSNPSQRPKINGQSWKSFTPNSVESSGEATVEGDYITYTFNPNSTTFQIWLKENGNSSKPETLPNTWIYIHKVDVTYTITDDVTELDEDLAELKMAFAKRKVDVAATTSASNLLTFNSPLAAKPDITISKPDDDGFTLTSDAIALDGSTHKSSQNTTVTAPSTDGVTTVVTATFAGNDYFKPATASYEVEVVTFYTYEYPWTFKGMESDLPILKHLNESGESDLSDYTVTYSSGNISIATIDANTGVFTGVAEGTVTLTAHFAHKSDASMDFTTTKTVEVYDFYKTWIADGITSITNKAGALDGFEFKSSFYEGETDSYAPILKADSQPLADLFGLLIKGHLRIYTASGQYIQMWGGGSIKIPVKKGMTVEIKGYHYRNRDLTISNVTDLDGNVVTVLSEKQNVSQTQYFYAAADGYIVIDVGDNYLYLESIKLYSDILLKDGEEIYLQRGNTEYQNEVLNATQFTSLAYTVTSGSEHLQVNAITGVLNPLSEGDATVHVVGTGTGLYAHVEKDYTVHVMPANTMTFAEPYWDQELETTGSVTFDGQAVTWTADGGVSLATMQTWVPKFTVETRQSTYPSKYPVTCSVAQEEGEKDYSVSVRYPGTVTVTATYGGLTASYDVNVSGIFFGESSVVIANGINTYTQTVATTDPVTYSIEHVYIDGKINDTNKPTINSSTGSISGIASVFADGKGGALLVKATNEGGTKTAEYVLTVAYHAKSGYTWNFYVDGLSTKIGDVDDADFQYKTVTDKDEERPHLWIGRYKEINKKSEPRWCYTKEVDGTNVMVVKETAGLIVNAHAQCFTARSRQDGGKTCFPNIGLRSAGSSLTIPFLKAGDYIRIKTIRHAPHSGDYFKVKNVRDLLGQYVTDKDDYDPDTDGVPEGHCEFNGAQHNDDPDQSTQNQLNRGWYTFRAATDGDVVFTLDDAGNADILAIKIYNSKDEWQTDFGYNKGYIYDNDMATPTLEDNGGNINRTTSSSYSTATYKYTYCNPLNSTNAGPSNYVLVKDTPDGVVNITNPLIERELRRSYCTEEKPQEDDPLRIYKNDEGQLVYEFEKEGIVKTEEGDFDDFPAGMEYENTLWVSGGGANYRKATIRASRWGKFKVRMLTYTAEEELGNEKYVTSYTPVATINVGVLPDKIYPYTWDFTNMGGGTLSDDAQNATTLVTVDAHNSTHVGTTAETGINWESTDGVTYSYKHVEKTPAEGSSFYTAGAMLVAEGDGSATHTGGILQETDGLGFDVSALSIDVNPATDQSTYKTTHQDAAESPHLTLTGTVTLPDLTTDHLIYIKASKEPSGQSNAEPVTSGKDAAAGVYEYSPTADGDCTFTFGESTEVYQIGVTNIHKSLTKIGTAEGWATESRERDIDYTLTGYFTTNAPKAYVVENAEYEAKADEPTENALAKVKMGSEQERSAVPHGTDSPKGLVLRQTSGVTDDYTVPLFVPAITTVLDENATFDQNLMAPAVEGKTFASETEGDNTVFILAKRYMTWKKDGNGLSHSDDFFTNGDKAVFYRLHLYDEAVGEETAADLNTIGANRAYLLLPTDQVPDALWNDNGGIAPRRFIGIEGVSDMEELEELEQLERQPRQDNRIYNLNGQVMHMDEQALPPGVYIRNGKKFVVKH